MAKERRKTIKSKIPLYEMQARRSYTTLLKLPELSKEDPIPFELACNQTRGWLISVDDGGGYVEMRLRIADEEGEIVSYKTERYVIAAASRVKLLNPKKRFPK
jgi:hypothetical protein